MAFGVVVGVEVVVVFAFFRGEDSGGGGGGMWEDANGVGEGRTVFFGWRVVGIGTDPPGVPPAALREADDAITGKEPPPPTTRSREEDAVTVTEADCWRGWVGGGWRSCTSLFIFCLLYRLFFGDMCMCVV